MSTKPDILTNDRFMWEITEDTWSVIAVANDQPFIFRRGGRMVDIVNSDSNQPVIRVMSKAAVKGEIDRLANFVNKKGDDEEGDPKRPPDDVVADLMASKKMPLPVLLGIIHSPIFTASGEIATAEGYQPETLSYLHLPEGLTISDVPKDPSAEDKSRAHHLIVYELLGEFPFVDSADLAHAVAALLLPFARQLIDGPTPLHLLESPSPGSGKTLLADVVGITTLGRSPGVFTEGKDDDEWRKRLTALLMDGPQVILIDNLTLPLNSGALSSALTASGEWKERIIGSSKLAVLPVRCLWLATANNPVLSPEIARRTVPIRIDARMERAWRRTGFRHEDLLGWTSANRGELIWAALTLIQAWIAAGRPQGTRNLASYERWAKVIGGILDVAGITGFLLNTERLYTEAVDEDPGWMEFFVVWQENFHGQTVTASELFNVAVDRNLLTDIWLARRDHGRKSAFGRALSKQRDRVIGGYCIRSAGQDSHSRAQLYQLEVITEDAGLAGVSVAFSRTEKIDSVDVGTPLQEEEQTESMPAQNFDSEISPAKPSKPSDEPVQRQWDLL